MNLDEKLLCCGFWLDVLGRGLLRFLLFICEREIGSAGSAPAAWRRRSKNIPSCLLRERGEVWLLIIVVKVREILKRLARTAKGNILERRIIRLI